MELRDKVCNMAKEIYGMRLQFVVAQEELAELIQVISKYIRLIDTKNTLSWDGWNGEIVDNMVEEIADVEIMLYQLKWFWNMFDEVKKKKDSKWKRTFKQFQEEAKTNLSVKK